MPKLYSIPSDRPSLTQYLHRQWLDKHQKNRLCTKKIQVRLYACPKHYINSDFPIPSATVAGSTEVRIVDRRGDQNVPKWYLKATRWNPEDDISDLPLGPGYYVINPDMGKDDWIPVNFDFNALQWGLTYQQKSGNNFKIYWPAPSKYGLWIYGEERVWDRSQWGPIDGITDPEEGISFQFRSDVDNTPEPEPEDISIPTIDQAEKLDSAITVMVTEPSAWLRQVRARGDWLLSYDNVTRR